MYEYEGMKRICYPDPGGENGDWGNTIFVPVCEKCRRFVKPDDSILLNYQGLIDQPNATCVKCGRTKMIFEGFYP